jgi:nicotinamide riboside kinase
MRSRGDTIAIVAAAWLELLRGSDPWTPLQLNSIDNERIDLALAILDEVPAGKQTEMDLRLTYDLVSQRRAIQLQSAT